LGKKGAAPYHCSASLCKSIYLKFWSRHLMIVWLYPDGRPLRLYLQNLDTLDSGIHVILVLFLLSALSK
jgi:hypothetical protein